MEDPLVLLRRYNVKKKEIIENDGQIIFGEFSWPKNVRTNYLIHGSGKNNLPKEYYTLECLIFFLKNRNYTHPVYVSEAKGRNIPAVKRPDRKNLLAYLNGEISTSLAIDRSAPSEPPSQIKRSAEYDASDIPKKLRLGETHVQKDHKLFFTARLEAPKESTSTVPNNFKSLSDAMSIERIAALKAKCLARKMIKMNDDKKDDSAVEISKDILMEAGKGIPEQPSCNLMVNEV